MSGCSRVMKMISPGLFGLDYLSSERAACHRDDWSLVLVDGLVNSPTRNTTETMQVKSIGIEPRLLTNVPAIRAADSLRVASVSQPLTGGIQSRCPKLEKAKAQLLTTELSVA